MQNICYDCAVRITREADIDQPEYVICPACDEERQGYAMHYTVPDAD